MKETLGDDGGKDEGMVCAEFSLHGIAVCFGLPMQVLIAVSTFQWLHAPHPEVIGEGPQDMDRLLKGMLNLESQAIDTDDLQWR